MQRQLQSQSQQPDSTSATSAESKVPPPACERPVHHAGKVAGRVIPASHRIDRVVKGAAGATGELSGFMRLGSWGDSRKGAGSSKEAMGALEA
eukprot:6514124-Prymnesium_polylepis.1